MIAVGAGAVALSTVLPWINVVLFGSLNLFDLYRIQGDSPVVPVVIILLAIVLIVLSLAKVRGGPVIALILGGVGGAVGGLFTAGVILDIQRTDGLVGLGIGPLVACGGAVTIVIASIICLSRT